MAEVAPTEVTPSRGNFLSRRWEDLRGLVSPREKSRTQLDQEARDEARRISGELSKRTGNKGVYIDVGYGAGFHMGGSVDERHGIWSPGFFVSLAFDGDQAASFYEEFRNLSPNENTTLVVSPFNARADATLKDETEVVRKIAEVSKEHGWPMPRIIGLVDVKEKHNYNGLNREFPDQYLGTINHNDWDPHIYNEAIYTVVERNLPTSEMRTLEDLMVKMGEARDSYHKFLRDRLGFVRY